MDQNSPRTRQQGKRPRGLGRTRRAATLITDARRSPDEDRRHREKVYAWIQGLRIPALLLSAMTYVWWENWWISAVLFVVSVPLPWIAVVIANGHGEPRDKRKAAVYKPGAAREFNQQLQQRSQESLETRPPAALAPPTVIDHDDDSEDLEDHKQ